MYVCIYIGHTNFHLPSIEAFEVDIFVGDRKSKFTSISLDGFREELSNAISWGTTAHGLK